MSWLFYLLAGVMFISVVSLFRAKTLVSAMYSLGLAALSIIALGVMLDAHTAVMAYLIMYGMGVMVSCALVFGLLKQQRPITETDTLTDSSSESATAHEQPSADHQKADWLFPSMLCAVLLSVILYFTLQTTGSFAVNEVSPRMVANMLWQNYSLVMMIVLFWLIILIMLIAQLLPVMKFSSMQATPATEESSGDETVKDTKKDTSKEVSTDEPQENAS